ncbi:hypothetical protein C6361_04915 [Plantactinospora sp. BC1]|uniref:hypothetical protein n=1 Tax=Plantactinospora sp. BC1 TaxID=2108470 RepID=UPI000D17A587|nr:hypothetical protein [Plantactinospora sp. BC1]AVT28942.1 hypothetical protein C6361_04915 [Plantactinospora sp. BC1]
MSTTPTERLLRELDPLPYPQRLRRLAPAVRALAGDGTLADVLAQLRGGDRYQRHLALTMALIGRDEAGIAAALTDADPTIRGTALRAALRADRFDTDDLVALVADASAQTRRLVCRTLARSTHSDRAEALLDVVRGRYGDAEAARLLPGCGAETVRRLLPELDHAIDNWSGLLRRHREIMLDYAEQVLAGLDAPARERWWMRRGHHLLRCADRAPGRILDLLDRYALTRRLPGDLASYGVLAAADPARVLRLLTDPARAGWLRHTRLPTALLDRLGRRDPTELVPLAERLRDDDTRFADLLAALPPRHRGTLYDAATAPLDRAQLLLSDQVLTVLPHAWRHREARRILALPKIAEDEARTLRYTAHLPWPEAEPALSAALRRADADDRATGYELLLAAAARSADPAAVADAVDRLLRLRNEQDPVRSRALLALAAMPRLLSSASPATLDRIARDTTEARDASGASRGALSQLAVAVLRHHPDRSALVRWSLRTFERLFDDRRLPWLGQLDSGLRRGQEHDFFATVRPWLDRAIERGSHQPVAAVARMLGRRARHIPELQRLLRRAIDPEVVSNEFREAVRLWLDDPPTRSERVAEVLRVDPSTVRINEVWQIVATSRTDLLDLVLPGPVPAGKFLSAGTRWTPPSARYAGRWLPRQQRALAELLERVAADAGTPVQTRAQAISAAAQLPEHGLPFVTRWVDSPNVNLAEAALGALPWTDRPAEALPILLGHADGDRARVATYAAGRAARFVAPSLLPGVLGEIATGRGKVTSRKEALRLLARFGGPESMRPLWDAWRQEGQHRDVRAAIVSAARLRLDQPECWQIVEQAADGSREDLLAVLAQQAEATAATDRHRYAALVVRACGHPDRTVARAAWAVLPDWAPWAGDLVPVVVAAVSDLHSEQIWPTVVATLGRLLDVPTTAGPADPGPGPVEPPTANGTTQPSAGPVDPSAADGTTQPGAGPVDPSAAEGTAHRGPLVAALAALVRLDGADGDPGGPAVDRPARRRIEELVATAVDWAGTAGPERDREPVVAAARLLAAEPEFVPAAGRLFAQLVRLEAAVPDELVADLAALAGLLADRPVLADRLATRLGERVAAGTGVPSDAVLLDAADRLADRTDPAGALFALALARAGGRYGWSRPWQELLHRLRRHPVPDVRSAALDVAMA